MWGCRQEPQPLRPVRSPRTFIIEVERIDMSKATDKARLVKVKLALAEKCERLAKVSKSTPKQNTMNYHAARFRRQAADLSR